MRRRIKSDVLVFPPDASKEPLSHVRVIREGKHGDIWVAGHDHPFLGDAVKIIFEYLGLKVLDDTEE